MTVHLYPEFVSVAKEHSEQKITDDEAVVKLKKIVDKLPAANLKTAATIIHHLSRYMNMKNIIILCFLLESNDKI